MVSGAPLYSEPENAPSLPGPFSPGFPSAVLFAKLNRIVLDNSTHRSGLNQHLFDYIEYCGLDTLTFIKSYLSNLQPYMIERRKDQEALFVPLLLPRIYFHSLLYLIHYLQRLVHIYCRYIIVIYFIKVNNRAAGRP